jgi:hypothetical protein
MKTKVKAKVPRKRRITISSAKAKGRNLQQLACQKISDLIGLPWGKDEVIASREGCQPGTDVRLVGNARVSFPFSVECKDHDKWSEGKIRAWIEQARANCMPDTYWILFLKKTAKIKKDKIRPIIVMDVDDFFEVLTRLGGFDKP